MAVAGLSHSAGVPEVAVMVTGLLGLKPVAVTNMLATVLIGTYVVSELAAPTPNVTVVDDVTVKEAVATSPRLSVTVTV